MGENHTISDVVVDFTVAVKQKQTVSTRRIMSECVNSCHTYFMIMLLVETYPTVQPDRRENDVYGQEKHVKIQKPAAFTHTCPLRSDRSVCHLQLSR